MISLPIILLPQLMNRSAEIHQNQLIFKGRAKNTTIFTTCHENISYSVPPWQAFLIVKILKIYIERCEEFKKHPPPENWDFVINIDKK